jgi:hypothetical protein
VTILVTSLAMNYVHRGSYFAEKEGQPVPKELLPAPPAAKELLPAPKESTQDAAEVKSSPPAPA